MTKTALVTGGNRGIGLEVVKGLAEAGCRVLMGCRDTEDGKRAIKELNNSNIHVIEMPLDSNDKIDDAITRAHAIYGGIDILINNAGVLAHKRLSEVSDDDVELAMQVHFKGPLRLIQKTLPSMQDNGFGRIINVSSGWGAFHEGMEGPVAYASSKAALNALTVSVSRELKDYPQITVNSVCPGWVHTRMGGKEAPRSPAKGAETILWLALSDSQHNGQFFRDKQTISW